MHTLEKNILINYTVVFPREKHSIRDIQKFILPWTGKIENISENHDFIYGKA